MTRIAESFGWGATEADEWVVPFVPRMPGGNARVRHYAPKKPDGTPGADERWSFDLSKVPSGHRVGIGGLYFEKVPLASEPDNDHRQWRRHASPDVSEPADLIYFEHDDKGNPTFANWGRVVLREGDMLGYAGLDNRIHHLGIISTLELIDTAGRQYDPIDAALYMDRLAGGVLPPHMPVAGHEVERVG